MLAALTAAAAVATAGHRPPRQDDDKKAKADPDDPKVKAEATDPANKAVARTRQNLFLILKTSPEQSEDRLRGVLKEGLDAAGCKFSGVVIKPMSISTFNELDEVINKGMLPAIPVPGPEVIGAVQVTPVTDRKPGMVLRFGPEYRDLQTLEVEFPGERKVTLTPQEPAAPVAKLPALVKGELADRYELKLDPKGEPPVRFTAKIKNVKKKDTPVETVGGDFPRSPRCFLVLIENFEGDRRLLFTCLTQKPPLKQIVSDPLEEVDVSNDVTVAFAYWKTDSPVWRKSWNANEFTLRTEELPLRESARAWNLFPVRENQVKELLEKYRRIGDPKQLIDTIAAEARASNTGGNAPIELGPDFNGSAPAWVQLNNSPNAKTVFTRKIILKKDQLPQIRAAYPKVYRLIVWEFENGKAMYTRDEGKGGEVFVIQEEVKDWVPGLSFLVPGK